MTTDRQQYFKLKAPEETEFTLTFTLRLKDWRVIRKAINEQEYRYDLLGFTDAIHDMVIEAERNFGVTTTELDLNDPSGKDRFNPGDKYRFGGSSPSSRSKRNARTLPGNRRRHPRSPRKEV